jgi:cytosine/adenosine deaminase-related metal-dependent hydrolase
LSSRLAAIGARLCLSDAELLAIFGLDALSAIGGDYGHRPEVNVLDGMTADAAQRAGEGAIASWVRSSVERPTPLELLEQGRFADFEDALERWLRDSGLLDG